MKELLQKRGKKLLFTLAWLTVYLSLVNRYNWGEGAWNFVLFYALIPALISLVILWIDQKIRRPKA